MRERELTILLLISCWIVKGGAAGCRCHRHTGGAMVVVSGWTVDNLMGCLPVIALMALAVADGDTEGGLSVR